MCFIILISSTINFCKFAILIEGFPQDFGILLSFLSEDFKSFSKLKKILSFIKNEKRILHFSMYALMLCRKF